MSRLILIICIVSCSLCYGQHVEKTKSLLKQMHYSIATNKDIRFTLLRSERDGNEYIKGSFDGKLTMDPFRVYLKNHFPNKGSEILYIKGVNNDKAWVNPNAFPFITISLHPENKLLLAGGHHTLKLLGFAVIDRLIKLYEKTYKDDIFRYIKYQGSVEWKGMNCHKIILTFHSYNIINYKAKKGDKLTSLAENKILNIAKLKELNPKIDPNKNLIPGQIIKLTNAYAKKAIIFIDTKSYLPVYQEIFDEKGLYEKYGYYNLKYGEKIPIEEFNIDYKEYDF